MTSWKDKLALTAQRNRQEIVKAKLSRREMMRLGLLTAGGALIAKAGLSSRAFGQAAPTLTDPDATLSRVPASPPVRPWVAPMPRLTVKTPVAPHDMDMAPPDGTTPIDGATKRIPHQYFSYTPPTDGAPVGTYGASPANPTYNFAPQKFYELEMKETHHQAASRLREDQVLRVRRTCSRAADPGEIRRAGPGALSEQAAVGEDPAGFRHRRDDHPFAQRPYPVGERRQPGQLLQSRVNDPNVRINPIRASRTSIIRTCTPASPIRQYGPAGNPNEALGSLWYHDHHLDFTAQNVYKGMFGCYNLFDDLDTGVPAPA